MNKRLFFLILLLCGMTAVQIIAQNLSFHHFTTDDGLSHNSVMTLYQDERGWIWMGTRDGLNLYNGKEFKVYKHEKDNPNSLPYNDIAQITGNGKGSVYIMTGGKGISVYDIVHDSFSTPIVGKVSAMSYERALFFARDSQIYRYENDSVRLIYQLPDSKVSINRLFYRNDSLLIGTYNAGLYLLEEKKKLSHLIPGGRVNDIYCDSMGDIWVSFHSGEGLYLIRNGEVRNFRTVPGDDSSISSSQVHCCCEDENRNIWIGTFDGLNKYDKRTGKFTRYYKKAAEKNCLSESSVWSLLRDHQGTIWAGTYYGGVNYFNSSKQIYREYNTSLVEEDGLSSPTVGAMTEDAHGNLWFCTEGGGVCSYNLNTGKFRRFTHNDRTNSISHNHAKTAYYDKKREALWIGTHLGGLNRLDLKTERFTHYRHRTDDPASLPSDIVMDIVPVGDKLVLGTIGKLSLFDPQTGRCEALFNEKEYNDCTSFCRKLAMDHRGVLWIANGGMGVSAYNFNTRKLITYRQKTGTNKLSSDHVNYIYEDSCKRLWFCTNEHGLDLYRSDTDDFENYDQRKNGLSSNVVYAICELDNNRMLVTTDNGFSILDCNTKQFTNYDKGQKIPLTSINENSLLKSSTGEIFIGGMDGMISFNEQEVERTARAYNIYPYRLTVNGQEVNVGDETGILTENLSTLKEIELPAKCNIFALEYTATDYLPIDKEELFYRLEGFSNEWVNMHGKNMVTYTGLAPGVYTLVVKTANAQNTFVPESRLVIKVLPPFYRTVWAYIFYVLLAVLLIYLLVRTYNNRIKLQESLKYEQKHAEDIERLNQVKLRFFTNISHEFRTPLTVIIGQLEMLLRTHEQNQLLGTSLQKIYRNSLQLQELITELLDFRKQTQGYMTLKVSRRNVVNDVEEYYRMFREYAEQKQINYKFVKTTEHIELWYDVRQMKKVMNNLISNAFKYTPKNGEIVVAVRRKEQEVLIEVTDTGKGIAAKDIARIFDRFYQTEDMESSSYIGTGIGLSLSKGIVELHHGTIDVYSDPGVETTFCVHLKMGKEHFKKEEICEQPQGEQPAIEDERVGEIPVVLLQGENESETVSELKAGNCKILIVEDSDNLRDMLANLFAPFYTVVTAVDGQEGLEKVQEEMPDIVVSDIMMPRMSGMELCKAIKENIDTCHIPVVLLTAKTAIDSTLEALKTGADDYITKPFNVQLLLSRCNNLVNSRIMMQEKFSKQPQSTHRILANNEMDKEFIDKAMEIVQKHMGDPDFNMDMFAREVGIARTKLFIKLKAISGQTPAEFILTIRLKEATVMLKNNPGLNIMEISDRLGFSSPKYFRKCFKDKYHVTPQEYRKEESS